MTETFWEEWGDMWPICSDPYCELPAIVEIVGDGATYCQCWQHGIWALLVKSGNDLFVDKPDEIDWITAESLGLPE